ncbi:hypothetical protein EVAR_50968_1 [Eumeta japonica]|uniref:Uncharacterized protein n=1 Tax=Eumeta variegata TaxID=151549 RepID=A0A4C1XDV5_EUMVA|nr:hypothetical protein EVAR_50968_1 [Eumeta japonica]
MNISVLWQARQNGRFRRRCLIEEPEKLIQLIENRAVDEKESIEHLDARTPMKGGDLTPAADPQSQMQFMKRYERSVPTFKGGYRITNAICMQAANFASN